MAEDETRQPEADQAPAAQSETMKATRSLSPEIRRMLLECPSHQAFFDHVLNICVEAFGPVVCRADYYVGKDLRSSRKNSERLAASLAGRFDDEYLAPFAASVLEDSSPQPRLKNYERTGQKMTLVGAPVMKIAEDKVVGAVTMMLTGDSVRPDIVLPRLDGIVSVA